MDPLLVILAIPISILAGLGASLVGLTAWPLVVPVLLIVGNYSPQEAILTSMIIDVVNATIVTLFFRKRTSVGIELGTGLRMGASAGVPAVIAAFLVYPILGFYADLFKGGSGVINMFLGSLFVIQAFRTNGVAPSEDKGASVAKTERWSVVYVFCVVQGIVTGIIGIGGAMNLVIVMLIFTSFQTRRAVGTAMSATVILLLGTISVYLVRSALVVPTLDIILLASSIASFACISGLLKSDSISEKYLRLAIGVVVLAAAVFSLLQVALL